MDWSGPLATIAVLQDTAMQIRQGPAAQAVPDADYAAPASGITLADPGREGRCVLAPDVQHSPANCRHFCTSHTIEACPSVKL